MANSSFSSILPTLQLGWDSTSIGMLSTCPRMYQLSMVHHLDPSGNQVGYAPTAEAVDLKFGILYHGACERYDHHKFSGASHEDALLRSLDWLLQETWDRTRKRPWTPDHKTKNRATLVRTVVWYLDQFRDDPAETVRLADGRPAVELSFRFPLDIHTADGEEFVLCGHLDRLATLGGETYILDRKTTAHGLDDRYFAQFSPHLQFTTYVFASQVVYGTPVAGLIVDAAQVAVTFSRFERRPISITEDMLTEYLQDLQYWLGQAERFAREGYWPMNRSSCGNYGGCKFRPICSKPPVVRDQWLHASYVQRVWDPLRVRGEI